MITKKVHCISYSFLFSKHDCAIVPTALVESLASNPNYLLNSMRVPKQHFVGNVLVDKMQTEKHGDPI